LEPLTPVRIWAGLSVKIHQEDKHKKFQSQ
jgi:hypothetical protein